MKIHHGHALKSLVQLEFSWNNELYMDYDSVWTVHKNEMKEAPLVLTCNSRPQWQTIYSTQAMRRVTKWWALAYVKLCTHYCFSLKQSVAFGPQWCLLFLSQYKWIIIRSAYCWLIREQRVHSAKTLPPGSNSVKATILRQPTYKPYVFLYTSQPACPLS